MARSRTLYVCQQCGYSQSQWAGKCPNCDQWNSLVEMVAEIPSTKHQVPNNSKIYNLQEIIIDEKRRISTGESELDDVLGGGLVVGMVVLVAGEPGIGKSTLLTQVALQVSISKKQETNKNQEPNSHNQSLLYVCGEESPSQVALRAKRLEIPNSKNQIPNLLLLESTNVDEIVSKIEEIKPGLVIVDSIQTLVTGDLTGVAGSVGQVRECAYRLTMIAKKIGVPVFLVGHVTKEGTMAGPRVLEHLVDTVLWFEGERGQQLRLVRAVKNRFGPTDQVGVFEMTESGLKGVVDASRLMLAERVQGVAGSVVSVIMEGRRPMLIEIQALAVATGSPIPRRVATGVDMARLQMLVAVLMKRAELRLEAVDIYVNVTGGIKLADRGVDLAICLAIASAFLNKPLAAEVAAVGEVGLLGEVRKVSNLEARVREAKKIGFKVASAESGKSVAAAIKKMIKGE